MLQVRLQQCRAERDSPFPHPAGNVTLNAPQGMVVFPGCLGTLLTHVQFAVDPDPQPLSVGLLSSVPFPGCVYVHGCPLPGTESGTCSYCTSCRWCLPSSLTCPHLSVASVEATTPNLVSSANLLKTSSSTTCKSFRKTLKRSGLKIETWGTLLVTVRQPDGTPFTVSLLIPC